MSSLAAVLVGCREPTAHKASADPAAREAAVSAMPEPLPEAGPPVPMPKLSAVLPALLAPCASKPTRDLVVMVGPTTGGWLEFRGVTASAPGYSVPCIEKALRTVRVPEGRWHCAIILTPRSPLKPGFAVATDDQEFLALGLGAILPQSIVDAGYLIRPTCPYPDP